MKQLQSEEVEESGCPLCHHKFESANDLRNLVEDVSTKLAGTPVIREREQCALDEIKELNEEIIKLAPVKANLGEQSLC